MGTMYALNVNSLFVFGLVLVFIGLIILTFSSSLHNKRLKNLIKLIDLMSYMTDHIGTYDAEIVEIANKLPLRLIKSVEGNFVERYRKLINSSSLSALGFLIHDHLGVIKDQTKRTYLLNLIETNVSTFSTEKLATLLSELLICRARNKEDNYELSIASLKTKSLIIKLVSQIGRSKRRDLFKLCDEYCALAEINEVGRALINADLIKIKAPYWKESLN